jgi:IS30 family transposase
MAQLGRPGLSASQKAELWKRWKEGQSLSDIGRALHKVPASIYGVVRSQGGFAPPIRRRSRLALSLSEREEISRGVASCSSIRSIAVSISRSPSTVSREIQRHGGLKKYRASEADLNAWDRGSRPKKCRLARHFKLRKAVASKLKLGWSPEQVSGWLKVEFPHDALMRVSHETIYRSLFIQARGVLKKALIGHLRSGRLMRHSKFASTKGQTRGQIVDGISIRDRPAEIEDRAIPGHWEGDLITGSNNTHIATLVERQSRYTMLIKVAGKDTATVVSALSKQVRKLPATLRRSLTWDRGTELAQHKRFTVATNVQVYFCDPKSPWQRGTNENTNRLLRQYFPAGTELSGYSQAALNKIAQRLNQRPRKTLGYQTPANKLNRTLR